MSLKETKKLSANRYELEIVIGADKFAEAIKQAYENQKDKISIPGFRKGKAPRSIIEKMYGAGIFYEDAINDLIPDAYADALKEAALDTVGQPEFDIVSIEEDVVMTAVMAIKPEIELADYAGIEVEAVLAPVTDEEVDGEIETVRRRNARETEVTDRPAEMGDTAVIDFEGFCDGVAFEGGKGTDYDLTIGSNTFIPGFEEQLIGMEVGEERDINVTFPEDYHAEDLKGAPVVFKVKVNEIKQKVARELDEEFFEDLGMEGIDSEEKLRDQIKSSITAKKEVENENQYVDELLAYYAASDCFVFPSYREGFPNTVMEAGAMGLPSIVTDINGSREIIIDGKNGVIIPSKDVEALYHAMEEMITNSDKTKEYADNAREMIASRFERSFVCQCLYDFYDETRIDIYGFYNNSMIDLWSDDIEGAKEKLDEHTKLAKDALAPFGDKAEFLLQFADMLLNRKN